MSDWLGLQDQVVVVTGGSSGIGDAIVRGLLEVGAKVANFDIHASDIDDTNLMNLTVDVSSRDQVEAATDEVMAHFGRVDHLVNNAGINVPALLIDDKHPKSKYELNDELFDRMISINQKGLFIVSQTVGRQMVKNGRGTIINLGSEAGLEGSQGQSAYAATKAAVYSYTRSWAKELGPLNLRVVGVAPGIMEATGLRTLAYEEALSYTRDMTVEDLRKGYESTTTTPLGRSGKLSEVSDFVNYLLSDRASYITGVTLNIAGGKTRG